MNWRKSFRKTSRSTAAPDVHAELDSAPIIWLNPFMQHWFLTYFPHPFFWFAALLAGFSVWAFVSERKVRIPHPKALRPFRLALESIFFGIAISTTLFGAAYFSGGQIGRELTAVFVILGIAGGGAYFVCPFLGYNFVWNMRFFSGPAPFFLLALMLLFAYMGAQAQFGF